MLHPNAQIRYINDAVGYGVFATKPIPKGTMVYVKDSLEIEVQQKDYNKHNAEVQTQIEKYSYMDENGLRIISWDLAKYVNHCCQANTLSSAYEFDVAVRDITKGEEITCDYGMLNVAEEMPLICNQNGCRKMLRPTDFEDNIEKWDAKVKSALAYFSKVEQPLLPFISGDSFDRFMEFLDNERKYESVSKMRCKAMIPQLV